MQVFSLTQNKHLLKMVKTELNLKDKKINLNCELPSFEEYSRLIYEMDQIQRKRDDFKLMKIKFLEERKHNMNLKT